MLKKTLTFLTLTAGAFTMAASPALAGTGGPFVQLADKDPIVQGGVSVQGTIKCAPNDNFRTIEVTLAQDGVVNTATGGIQCDGKKQHFDVYVSGNFHPGEAKAAAVVPANEGSNERALHDQRTVQLFYPSNPCSSSASTFC